VRYAATGKLTFLRKNRRKNTVFAAVNLELIQFLQSVSAGSARRAGDTAARLAPTNAGLGDLRDDRGPNDNARCGDAAPCVALVLAKAQSSCAAASQPHTSQKNNGPPMGPVVLAQVECAKRCASAFGGGARRRGTPGRSP